VRAKLRAAGTALLLVAGLCAAAVATDTEATMVGTSMTTQAAFNLPSGPHQTAIHRAPVETIIPPGRSVISVPIVLYHYIRDVPKYPDVLGYNLSTTVETFKAEMDWLAANDYHPVTMEDLSAYFTENRPLPGKPVVLTFDDGYLDLYTTAFPILQAHGFKAVAYIVTGFVNQPRYVTSAMIQEMDASGIEIASHTVTHPNLARTPPLLIAYQVQASKSWLEQLLGKPVVDFAYPSGKFSVAAEDALAHAGYSTAVTEQLSTYHAWASRFLWARERASGGDTLQDFIHKLGPIEPYITVKQALI
jgi:peptidoglycan/xylan/chitin deacetylase (PgdA/CDA1 family)